MAVNSSSSLMNAKSFSSLMLIDSHLQFFQLTLNSWNCFSISCKNNYQFWICCSFGNGSSFNESHIAGDYQKTFHHKTHYLLPLVKITVLQVPFRMIFHMISSSVARSFHIKAYVDTLVIFLSGSGNSENLIQAANKVNLHLSADITTVTNCIWRR